jgi:hypothetical protein
MRLCCALAVALACSARAQQNADLQAMLNRVSEEAEVFAYSARAVLSEETLRQKARKGAVRFRPRIGEAATKLPKEEFQTREIVSEYGYSSFKDSPAALHEFRTITSVDGKKVATQEKARRTLTMGMRSNDDGVKKRMLQDFEKHGLIGAATDFGQLILLFSKRRLKDYEFEIKGRDRIGADTAIVIAFHQNEGKEALTVFAHNAALRNTLQGFLWVRLPDYLPLRIRLLTSRKEGPFIMNTEGTVDYAMSTHGCLLPASVVHRDVIGDKLITENIFQYTPFRKFGAESELKFDTP